MTLRRLSSLVACLLCMSACAPTVTDETATRLAPTLPPLTWQTPGDPITVDNVAQVQALGRLTQVDTPSTLMDFAVAPDATRLAAISNTQIIAWDLISGETVFASGRGEVSQLYYAPDKTEIYGINPDGEVIVYNAETGGIITAFQGHPEYYGSAAYHPDDGWLALGGTDGSVKVWDPLERTALVTLQAHEEDVSALALSPNGAALVTTSFDNTVRLWNWRERALLHEWALDDEAAQRLAFAQDRVAAGVENGALLWAAGDGAELQRFVTDRGGATSVLQFSPDGRYLLGGSRAIGMRLWRMDDFSLLTALPDVDGASASARFSPEGDLLVTAAVGVPVMLWNLTQVTGDTIARAELPIGLNEILNVEWTSDGRLLLFFDARGTIAVWGIPQAAPMATPGA
jgi:WD40 repeat protein